MNRLLLFVCATIAICNCFIAVAKADPERVNFVLAYKTKCSDTQCRGTSQSQEFLTKINPEGKVSFEVKGIIGSISRLILNYTIANNDFSVVGNLTFGVHQNHDSHSLSFKSATTGYTFTRDGHTGFGDTWQVTAGFGALQGVYGALSMVGNAPASGSTEGEFVLVGDLYLPQ